MDARLRNRILKAIKNSSDDNVAQFIDILDEELKKPDMLEELFRKQEALQKRLGYDFSIMSDSRRAEYVKEYAQHTDHEMHEMLAEIPFFKSWKKYSTSPTVTETQWFKARLEFVDALHFMINCALALGFTPETLLKTYISKNNENHVRQNDKDNYKPCVENEGETRGDKCD